MPAWPFAALLPLWSEPPLDAAAPDWAPPLSGVFAFCFEQPRPSAKTAIANVYNNFCIKNSPFFCSTGRGCNVNGAEGHESSCPVSCQRNQMPTWQRMRHASVRHEHGR